MKFLNDIDGADKLITDSAHRVVTDAQIEAWDSGGASGNTFTELYLGKYKLKYNSVSDTLDILYVE